MPPLRPVNPACCETFESDQIEAAAGILMVGHANGQIQSGLEVVAGNKVALRQRHKAGPVARESR